MFPQRIVVRYEGEDPYQPEVEIDDNTPLVHVEHINAPLHSPATEKTR
jgi:hypothetical protein